MDVPLNFIIMTKPRVFITVISSLLLSLLVVIGCNQMSEIEIDTSAELNGGFEISKNGLPVNWLMYTQNTVPDGKFSAARL